MFESKLTNKYSNKPSAHPSEMILSLVKACPWRVGADHFISHLVEGGFSSHWREMHFKCDQLASVCLRVKAFLSLESCVPPGELKLAASQHLVV